jgi:hypothetical protein
MKKLFYIPLAVLLITVSAVTAQQRTGHPAEAPPPIHNGLWWGNKSGLFHDAFVTGYKSGTMHAAGHAVDINQFPTIELVEGVNNFYKDFRNRNILVDDVLNYVQDQLRGVPDEKLNAELLKMRAAAAPTNVE